MNSLDFLRSSDSLAAYGEYSHDFIQRSSKTPYSPQNSLGSALSPYLREHASDPVGWQEWSAEAFGTARREDRLLFVTAGCYGSHWCRIMTRSCWHDQEVAGMLNSAFVPVMVDLHERPDVDALLSEYCRLQAGQIQDTLAFFPAPLNVFLDSEGRVFFAATWLPKRTMGEVPGLTELLPRIKWLWLMQRPDVERSAYELNASLTQRAELLAGSRHKSNIKHSSFEAMAVLKKAFNIRWGGFSWAGKNSDKFPKFPHYTALHFLLQLAKSGALSEHQKSDALTITDITLRRMWRGGIHDHLGGGFHHYSADERWHLPHFEKLLCEQALMLLIASLFEDIDAKPFNRLLAEDVIFCALHDFATDNSYSQGFRASIGGDIPDAEGEGRFFLWTEDDIKRILPENYAGLFCSAYGVLPGGNFSPEFGGSQMGQNILYEASTVTELAKRYGLRPNDIGEILNQCRKLLLDARGQRVQFPHDNKILLGWNGLMIGAMARASVSFSVPEWKDLAERTALFLHKNLQDKNGSFYRCWLDGQRWGNAQCEDYAYFLWGVCELYNACKHFGAGDKQLGDWLNNAKALADSMLSVLKDDTLGGLYMSDGKDTAFPVRLKSPEDMHFLPNANAVAAIALSELGVMLQEKSYSDAARHIIDCFSAYADDNPLACISLLTANTLWTPVKPKPKPAPKPVLTDEQLNAEPIPSPAQEHDTQQTPSRQSRHSSARQDHSDAGTRRRSARTSRRREH
ncbi:MAG: thioredoxin domain-containing protein [Synergistaceae bacterium]|nr:thioredoxin domain-containing protein [Synergistaceae bacterium]